MARKCLICGGPEPHHSLSSCEAWAREQGGEVLADFLINRPFRGDGWCSFTGLKLEFAAIEARSTGDPFVVNGDPFVVCAAVSELQPFHEPSVRQLSDGCRVPVDAPLSKTERIERIAVNIELLKRSLEEGKRQIRKTNRSLRRMNRRYRRRAR